MQRRTLIALDIDCRFCVVVPSSIIGRVLVDAMQQAIDWLQYVLYF
jgi:hypothetical protein